MVITLQITNILLLVLAACFFGYFLRRALQTGECFMGGQRLTRADQPIGYWACVAVFAFWVISASSVALHFIARCFL